MSWLNRKNAMPFTLAVAVHVGLLVFFIVNLDWVTTKPPVPQMDLVNATIVDRTEFEQPQKKRDDEQARQKKLEEAKQAEKKRKEDEQRQKEAEQQRQQEEKRAKEAEAKRVEQQKAEKLKQEKAENLRKEQELQKKKQADDEAKKKAADDEAKKKKVEEDAKRKKKEEDDRKRKQAEEETKRQLDEALAQEAEEMDAARSRELAKAKIGYIDAIALRVKQFWRVPPTAKNGMKCTIDVTQAPNGAVLTVNVTGCSSSDPAFQRSVEGAVYAASPLPKPSDPALFERDLHFTLTYEEQH